MAVPKFEYEELFANPNAQVMISFAKGEGSFFSGKWDTVGAVPVTGFLMNNISIGGGNDWGDSFLASLGDNLNQMIKDFQSVIGQATSAVGMGTPPPISTKFIRQTVKQWTGSKIPEFTLDLAFLAVRPDDDVTLPVRRLLEAVYPVEGDAGTLVAPLGYNERYEQRRGDVLAGTALIRIGQWFQATNQIINSVEFELSKEVTSEGLPLLATGKIEFQPYRALTYDDLMDYFIKADMG